MEANFKFQIQIDANCSGIEVNPSWKTGWNLEAEKFYFYLIKSEGNIFHI